LFSDALGGHGHTDKVTSGWENKKWLAELPLAAGLAIPLSFSVRFSPRVSPFV
jgi:hypothetical protein